jgi:hypothetical protein
MLKVLKMEKINIEKSKEYRQKIFSLRLYSNYFGLPFAEGDLYVSTDHTFILAKPSEGFYRLFVASDNREDLTRLLKSIEGVNVLNIPSKDDITGWKHLMSDAGYENIGIYERLYYSEFRTGGDLDKIIYAKENEVEEIYNLYYGYEGFTPYVDYLPSKKELRELINEKGVIIDKQDDKICGVHIFSIKGKTCDSKLLLDMNNNGLKLFWDLFDIVYLKGINYIVGWVNTKNKKAKSIYLLLGGKLDGLKDYTFIKNK